MPITLPDTNGFPAIEGIADGEDLEEVALNRAASSLTRRTRWLKDCWQMVAHAFLVFDTDAVIFQTTGAPYGTPATTLVDATGTSVAVPAQAGDLLVLESSLHLEGVSGGSRIAFRVNGTTIESSRREANATPAITNVTAGALIAVTGTLATRTAILAIVPWSSDDAILRGPGFVRAYVLRSGGSS